MTSTTGTRLATLLFLAGCGLAICGTPPARLCFKGATGVLDYCQFVENKDAPGEPFFVLVLHGRSGSGDDNTRQLTTPAVAPLLNFVRTNAFKTVIIIPQCPADGDWIRNPRGSPLATAAELVKVKTKEFNIPPKRVFITGVSMGGGACYALLAKENGLFAKAVVVSAGGRATDAARINCGVDIYHGEHDRVIPLERARAMAAAISGNRNASVSFTVLKGKGHADAAAAAYSGECWRRLFETTPDNASNH